MTVALPPATLLEIWERGRDRHPIDQALLMLAATHAGGGIAELAALPIGERDARLLAVHAATFGDDIEARAGCPGCGAELEFSVQASNLRRQDDAIGPAPITLDADGAELEARRPNSRDLAAIAHERDIETARAILIQRLVLRASQDGEAIAPDRIPAALVDRLEIALEQADAASDITFALSCPGCGHHWHAAFDIARFLWAEIAAAANRLANEVAVLARAFGWRETDIVAMTPARRRIYLELAG